MQEIDDIFEDEAGDDDVELSAQDIEQLQLLEDELSRRAKGDFSQERRSPCACLISVLL